MADHATTYSDKFVYHEPGLQHQFDDMKQQEESVSIGMWMFLVQEIMFFGGLFTAYLVFRSRYPMAFAAGSNHLDAFWGGLNTIVLIVSSLTMALTVYYAQKGNRNLQMLFIVLTMLFGMTFLGVKVIEYTDKYNHGLVPVAGLNRKAKAPAATESGPTSTGGETHAAASSSEHGAEEHVYVNPRGEFQWTDTSLAKLAEDHHYLTEAERNGYYSNGVVDANKFRDKVRIYFWIYFAMTGLHALHMIIGLALMAWLLYK